MRRLAALAAALLVPACGGGSGGGGDEGQQPGPPAPPAPVETLTDDPTAPPRAEPPVGVTWNVGFASNVTRAQMQSVYATLVGVNNALWHVSEGQVRIHRIRFSDAVAPAALASTFFAGGALPDTSAIDVLVFSPSSWDVGAVGAVGVRPGLGRTSRLMAVPSNATPFIWLHEASHMVFRLSWLVAPLLVDEYLDGVQDAACVMEAENPTVRWCSEGNHVVQAVQPHACWRQILADYPMFRYAGRDTAAGLPPAPIAEYADTP